MPVYFKIISATVLLASAICTQVSGEPYGSAVLQALDKVTARVSTFEAPVGDSVRFGTLNIITRACDKRPPEDGDAPSRGAAAAAARRRRRC